MDTNNEAPHLQPNSPNISSTSSSPSQSPKSGRSAKKISKTLLLLIILAAAVFGGYKWYDSQPKSSDYNLAEIDDLAEDQQKKVLEDQLKDYQKRAEALPSGATTSERYAVYIKLAELQNRLGLYTDAIASLGKIAEERAGTSRIWALYAVAHLGLDDKNQARENIQKALAIDDQTPDYWKTYVAASQYEPAAELDKVYADALAKTNNDLDLVIQYARFLEAQGNEEKAIGYWETARNVNPDGAAQYEAEIARLRN